MAERTGNPELDAFIEEFATSNVPRDCFFDWEWDPPVHEFAPGPRSMAMGNCGSLTIAFNRFLADRGIKASEYNMGEDDPTGTNTWAVAGYQSEFDSMKSEAEGHTVSVVCVGDATYMIDWTAGQFGCAEFPLVQRKSSRGWERDWPTVEFSREVPVAGELKTRPEIEI